MTEIKFVDLTEQMGRFAFAWLFAAPHLITHFYEPEKGTWGIPTQIFESWEHFECDYKANPRQGVTLADFRAAFPPEHLPDEYAPVIHLINAAKLYKSFIEAGDPNSHEALVLEDILNDTTKDAENWLKEREERQPGGTK